MSQYLRRYINEPITVAFLGLSEAGKSTWALRLKDDQFDTTTTPTVGNQIYHVNNEILQIQITDVGGQELFRKSWEQVIVLNEIIVFVLDAAAPDQLQEAKQEFDKLTEIIQKQSVIILAHKQDLESARSEMDIQKLFDEKTWPIVETSAKTGQGVDEFYHILLDIKTG